MVKVGIIGYGYWGPNLARNFFGNPRAELKYIADNRQERLKLAGQLYPKTVFTETPHQVMNDPEVDAVIIATPVFSHYELAKEALQKGKHVLLEKPMTASSKDALALIDLAEEKGLSLMVDHTFLYNGAVRKIKDLVEDNTVGNIQYFDSTRINLGLFQPDINVLWDLAPHDISILLHVIEEKPISVQSTGISHTDNGLENIAYMSLKYKDGIIAHFNCSWTSPVKIRMILIGGDKKMLVYNDMEASEKVKVYDTGYEVKSDADKQKILVDYRAGDIYVPKLDTTEALKYMSEDFIASILDGIQPLSNNTLGYQVVRIIEAAEESLRNGSKEILLNF